MNTGKQGTLFVLSGPSGVGKGTVIDKLSTEDINVEYSISVTTREPRRGEEDGQDYIFVNEDEFFRMVEDNKFIEWARVHNNYYGTLKRTVQDLLNKGKDVILEIDIQGARQIRDKFPAAILIFLLPPSLDELENRLDKRGSEDPDSKKTRLENARQEMNEISYYDYQVKNDNLEDTVYQIKEIIKKESKLKE